MAKDRSSVLALQAKAQELTRQTKDLDTLKAKADQQDAVLAELLLMAFKAPNIDQENTSSPKPVKSLADAPSRHGIKERIFYYSGIDDSGKHHIHNIEPEFSSSHYDKDIANTISRHGNSLTLVINHELKTLVEDLSTIGERRDDIKGKAAIRFDFNNEEVYQKFVKFLFNRVAEKQKALFIAKMEEVIKQHSSDIESRAENLGQIGVSLEAEQEKAKKDFMKAVGNIGKTTTVAVG